MNLKHIPLAKLARSGGFLFLAIVLIVLIAGPEFGVAVDLTVMLDVLGSELFLMSFVVGIRMLPWQYLLNRLEKLVGRVDPYFFLPSRRQLAQCPPLVAHALPLCVPLCLATALWGTIQHDL